MDPGSLTPDLIRRRVGSQTEIDHLTTAAQAEAHDQWKIINEVFKKIKQQQARIVIFSVCGKCE